MKCLGNGKKIIKKTNSNKELGLTRSLTWIIVNIVVGIVQRHHLLHILQTNTLQQLNAQGNVDLIRLVVLIGDELGIASIHHQQSFVTFHLFLLDVRANLLQIVSIEECVENGGHPLVAIHQLVMIRIDHVDHHVRSIVAGLQLTILLQESSVPRERRFYQLSAGIVMGQIIGGIPMVSGWGVMVMRRR